MSNEHVKQVWATIELADARKLLDNVGPNITPELCARLVRWCADYDARKERDA